jgi:dolichol-phosphate mannosyltransferase
MPEEAYYWNYAQHLDIGYLDHPPMVGWLIAAGAAVLGDTELGVRIGALLCAVIASVFVYRLTRDMFGELSGWVAVVLAQTLPFFFFAGILMTPDAPLTAAWASGPGGEWACVSASAFCPNTRSRSWGSPPWSSCSSMRAPDTG